MGYELVSSSSPRLAGSPLTGATKCIIAGVAAAVAAAVAPVANAGIELGEGLSVTGFVDMSYSSNSNDGAPGAFGIDQVETDFLYAGSNGVSAQVDIEYGEDASDISGADDTFVEQAFITKKFNDQFSMKVGRFLSYSGWETEEPTGLFQYSGVGYAKYFYGYYQQGVSATYNGGKFALMGSLVNDVFGYTPGGPVESSTKDMGYELGVAIMPVEGLTAKLFYMSDKKTDRDVFNLWASYAMGGFTFAAEYNDGDFSAAGKGDGFLLMGNYASGPWGVTLRYHDWDIENGLGTSIDKVTGFTLSPSYKVGKNLLLVAEYRKDNVKAGGGDSNTFALEALFTF
ncbi:MAG: porin [Steroidobacteraceae bacterium]